MKPTNVNDAVSALHDAKQNLYPAIANEITQALYEKNSERSLQLIGSVANADLDGMMLLRSIHCVIQHLESNHVDI